MLCKPSTCRSGFTAVNGSAPPRPSPSSHPLSLLEGGNVTCSHVIQTACALHVLSGLEQAKSKTVACSHKQCPADMQQIECFCMCATHKLGAVHHAMHRHSWPLLLGTVTEQIAAEVVESMKYLSFLCKLIIATCAGIQPCLG